MGILLILLCFSFLFILKKINEKYYERKNAKKVDIERRNQFIMLLKRQEELLKLEEVNLSECIKINQYLERLFVQNSTKNGGVNYNLREYLKEIDK